MSQANVEAEGKPSTCPRGKPQSSSSHRTPVRFGEGGGMVQGSQETPSYGHITAHQDPIQQALGPSGGKMPGFAQDYTKGLTPSSPSAAPMLVGPRASMHLQPLLNKTATHVCHGVIPPLHPAWAGEGPT
ncbi:hypothetical protein P7K49_029436 [Saguinus oedipus]|uniref:Uncharacterized protein n=1 Tax=Saguinus oedipus TaxID=9490 RepID=A0ABQ9U769_SAGOE|nr:hypothetical protein P7K49_029436 [Saguinus oedipus]